MWLRACLSFLPLVLPSLVNALDADEMAAHLAAAQPLLGDFEMSSSGLASWMGTLDDSMPVTALSLPGTHDSLAWNVSGISASFTKTQDLPLFKQLDGGVRFLDLRIGETNGQIMLYHGSVLLDETAQLVDVFWGLYNWLDAHPSETVIVSVKVDNGETTQSLEQSVYDAVTGPEVAEYWVQSTVLPTLGEARHKAVLLRRFAFDLLPDIAPVGIEAGFGWADNEASFAIVYDEANPDAVLNIEDLYDLPGPDLAAAADQKYAAVSANLDLATDGTLPNQMFITFASGYSGIGVSPYLLAVGNGTDTEGVNTKVLNYLASKRGSRFGAVLFDFIGSDERLVLATLSQEVDLSATPTQANPTNADVTTRPLDGGVGGGVSVPVRGVLVTIGLGLLSLTGFVVF